MAKKTKDSNLSFEERLEQALIPNWDEPYKLPQNWCWAKFLYCSKIRTGKKDANYGSENGEYPFFTCASDPLRCDGYTFDCYAILLAGNGDISNISIYNGKFEAYQRTYVVETLGDIDTKYAYYYFKYRWVDFNQDKMFGSAIPYIRLGNLQDFPFPIAPPKEQERIVQCVDSLFAKLDEAKEKVQEIVDGFETRKAAILHKAFSGELTAKWREENGISNNTWVTKSLGDVCKSIYDGDHMPPPKSESGIPFLVISNVNTGYLSFEDTRFVPKEYYDNISDTRKPKKGDVLYTLVGSYGIPVVVDTDNAFCFQRHMALLKPLSIDTYFLWYLLQTQEMYQKASKIAKGVAQLTVPIKGLRAIEFSCPSSEEQEEIVKLLDVLIKKEQGAKDTAEAVIEQIDTMKKAILARAFRGELGTNDPSEESAVELLKQVLNTAPEQKTTVKRTVIPKLLESRIKTDLERKIIKLYIQNEVNVLTIDLIMCVSSKKFDIMEALRNLQQRGLLEKENDKYKLLG